MEEGTFHIHVMYLPSLGSCNCQDKSDGIHSSYSSECLIVVQSLNLRVSFVHNLSLVLGFGSIGIYLGLVDAFAWNKFPTWR